MFFHMHPSVSTLCEMKNEMKWAVKRLYRKSKDFMHNEEKAWLFAFRGCASEVSTKSHTPSKLITLLRNNHPPTQSRSGNSNTLQKLEHAPAIQSRSIFSMSPSLHWSVAPSCAVTFAERPAIPSHLAMQTLPVTTFPLRALSLLRQLDHSGLAIVN
jgi:hypothetical protein